MRLISPVFCRLPLTPRRLQHTQKFLMSAYERYGDWSRTQLLRRIAQLEGSAATAGTATPPLEQPASESKVKKPRPFDVSAQPCRKIALRFCYDGGNYSGLAAQTAQPTPLPVSYTHLTLPTICSV